MRKIVFAALLILAGVALHVVGRQTLLWKPAVLTIALAVPVTMLISFAFYSLDAITRLYELAGKRNIRPRELLENFRMLSEDAAASQKCPRS